MRLGRTIVALLRDLLFPPRCAGCRTPGHLLCPRCVAAMPLFADPRCPRCDLPAAGGRLPCASCGRGALPGLDGLRLSGGYRDPLRAAILALKFDGRQELAAPLGTLLADRWKQAGRPVDGLVPVPLHPSREAQRGFNQARLLAEAAAEQLELPVRNELLQRIRPTEHQVGLPRDQRRHNVAGAFRIGSADAAGRWLLVDDVCTTGATLGACAAALRDGGAAEVWALTLARPVGHDSDRLTN